jgi:hypothetical protein
MQYCEFNKIESPRDWTFVPATRSTGINAIRNLFESEPREVPSLRLYQHRVLQNRLSVNGGCTSIRRVLLLVDQRPELLVPFFALLRQTIPLALESDDVLPVTSSP